ncbi:hypothetical protein Ddye_001114 [Dipteronia dyeriana]|uniref:Protein FAR1-RELATED SEQUENCE n=1 Tax=Dipteronia dyeriana TaxID=168575 RepID=A0AAD9XNM4_9ROSI|nr:hypothetical protein Ddye_001114 [Dipteronia dyeriana]
MNDLDDEIDHSLFIDQIVSTTPVFTSNISNLPKLTELDKPGQFRSLQPTDVIGKEFGSVEDVESFYSIYFKAVGFSTRKDEMRRDRQGVITRRSVNHHKSTTIFSFGLLEDETIEKYTWLLRTFLVAMHGIPCSHTFSVIKAMNIQSILSSLKLTRWTSGAKHMIDIDYSREVTLTPTMELARYGSLSAKCNKLCYFASKSNDRFKEADRDIEKLIVRMQELMPSSPLASAETVLCPKDKQHVHNVRDHGIVAATKGCSACKKTVKVKSHKYGNCGKAGHTVKTCHKTQLHNNITIASNTLHMLDPCCTENSSNSIATPSSRPSYEFTFPINDGGMGYMSPTIYPDIEGFNPSSSTFDLHVKPRKTTAAARTTQADQGFNSYMVGKVRTLGFRDILPFAISSFLRDVMVI